jgi:large subunit ribosomal protein L10
VLRGTFVAPGLASVRALVISGGNDLEKRQKERIVAELTERLQSAQTLIVADYRGLTMTEIDALRGKLLEVGARFSVVKNTLTRRAAEAAGSEALLALLEGPTAIAFLEAGGDPVAVAKALADAARTTRILTIRGGVLEGRIVTEAEVTSLATLPPVDILRAQVLGAVTSPLYAIVGLFTAPLRNLHGLIDARIEQLGGFEETEPPLEEPEAAETDEPAAEETTEEPISESNAGEDAEAPAATEQEEA